jgi:hypothetical protein
MSARLPDVGTHTLVAAHLRQLGKKVRALRKILRKSIGIKSQPLATIPRHECVQSRNHGSQNRALPRPKTLRRIGYTSVFIGYLADVALGTRKLHLAPRDSCASDGVLRPTGPGSPARRVGGGVCAHHDAPPTCSTNGSSHGYTLRPLARLCLCQVAIFLGDGLVRTPPRRRLRWHRRQGGFSGRVGAPPVVVPGSPFDLFGRSAPGAEGGHH